MEYILIVLCLIFSGFFSGTEIAYTSLSKMKIKQMEESKNPLHRLVCFIYNHYDFSLSTILIGNNLVNIAATSVATVLAVKLAASSSLTNEAAASIVTIVMTCIILVIGEIIPKMIARRRNAGFAKMAAYPLMVLMILFFPVVWLTSLLVKLLSLLWRKKDAQEVTITEEELENLLDTAEDEGVIDEAETELLQSALEFTDMDASEILTPRIDVVGFEIGDSIEHILEVIQETQFSRYPVYEKTIDHVVGILIAKHLLRELVDNPNVQLKDLMLEPFFIPKSMHLHDIMDEFRKNRSHMVFVADEYGGIMGIVTMEDVLEQLVGDIWDENDDIVNDWQELSKNRYECSGDLSLTEFCDNLDLDDDELESDCATVGGWATEVIGAMPVPFDSFDYKQYTILVKAVDDNLRISRLLILEHSFASQKETV